MRSVSPRRRPRPCRPRERRAATRHHRHVRRAGHHDHHRRVPRQGAHRETRRATSSGCVGSNRAAVPRPWRSAFAAADCPRGRLAHVTEVADGLRREPAEHRLTVACDAERRPARRTRCRTTCRATRSTATADGRACPRRRERRARLRRIHLPAERAPSRGACRRNPLDSATADPHTRGDSCLLSSRCLPCHCRRHSASSSCHGVTSYPDRTLSRPAPQSLKRQRPRGGQVSRPSNVSAVAGKDQGLTTRMLAPAGALAAPQCALRLAFSATASVTVVAGSVPSAVAFAFTTSLV